ncbi:MAG: M1 family metallopeptidase [Anaerolineales bacterium]
MTIKRSLLVLLIVLLAACAPLPPATPGTATGSSLPAATMSLPPAHTATPSPEPSATPRPVPTLAIDDPALGLLPQFSADVQRLGLLTTYSIEITVELSRDGRHARIDGTCLIQFRHDERQSLEEIALMLWPNDPQYQSQMTVESVQVDGRLADTTSSPDGIALRVRLPRPLEAGRTVELFVPFSIEAGEFTPGAPRRFGLTHGVLIAPTFYPLIPPRIDGEWQVEPAPPGGDTTNSDTAYYQLTVHADPDLAVAASGVELPAEGTDVDQGRRFISGPMRDLAIAVGPLEEHDLAVGDVALRAWLLPEHAGDADTLLEAARTQVDLLQNLAGPYRYPELDLVDAPGAFGGIEYPGLVYLGTIGTSWMIEPIVHEVAHQWFYALIGDDQLREPWLDEAAATYMTALYYEEEMGTGRAAGFLSDLRSVVRQQPDPELPIGLPVDAYGSENAYAVFVYFKGALFFDALRNTLGEADFKRFLQAYYQQELYRIADAADFQAAAEGACGCSLQTLFDRWVYVGGDVPGLE